jgi:hypothetical protein
MKDSRHQGGLSEHPVFGPKGDAAEEGGRQKMHVDQAQSSAHEGMVFDERKDFIVLGDRRLGKFGEEREYLPAVPNVADRQLSNDEGVGKDMAVHQPVGQRGFPDAKVGHPYRSVDEDPQGRRRGTVRIRGSVPPRRASRRAAS